MKNHCDWPTDEQCGSRPITINMAPSTGAKKCNCPGGVKDCYFADMNNCNGFFQCSKGKAYQVHLSIEILLGDFDDFFYTIKMYSVNIFLRKHAQTVYGLAQASKSVIGQPLCNVVLDLLLLLQLELAMNAHALLESASVTRQT